MASHTVVLVVDGAIEIAPEHLQSVGVHVVPRQAKIGRQTVELNAERTADSIADLLAGPARVSLSPPSVTAFSEAYTQILDKGYDVLSLHIPATLDQAAVKARMARNLVLPFGLRTTGAQMRLRQNAPLPSVRVLELPTPGIGITRVIEILAVAAQRGFGITDLMQLAERLNTDVRSFFVVRRLSIPRRQLASMQVTRGSPAKSHLLVEVARSSGRFLVRAQDIDPAQLAEQVNIHQPRLNAELRQSGYDAALQQIEARLGQKGIRCRARSGHSLLLRSYFGHNLLEGCLLPAREYLERILQAAQRARDAGAEIRSRRDRQRNPDGKRRMRLSEYEVHLR